MPSGTAITEISEPARLLRRLFFLIVVRPLVTVVLGVNLRHSERLPRGGPAILVANHNSHLDTLVLMTLLPQQLLPRIRPVAAIDYFFENPVARLVRHPHRRDHPFGPAAETRH